MRCKITGIKTKVRYKGRPISAKFLETAIQMAKNDEAADVPHALEIMEKAWKKQIHAGLKEAVDKENEAGEKITKLRKFLA